MALPKKLWVRILSGVVVPGAVLGTEADRRLAQDASLALPRGYAQHLVALGLARLVSAPTRKAKPEPVQDPAPAPQGLPGLNEGLSPDLSQDPSHG